MQAEKKQTLTINGEKVEKLLTRITFEGDNAVLTFGDNTTQTADMEAVILSFSVDDLTAIGTIKGNVGNKLSIDGLEPDTEVEIYDAQGKKLLTAHIDETRAILNTRSLKNGVYLLKANRQVVKFIKR